MDLTYGEHVEYSACVLSTGSTMYYLDARFYTSTVQLNFDHLIAAKYSDLNSLEEILKGITKERFVYFSTIVIVDMGSTAEEVQELYRLLKKHSFRVYIIPTLMARILASFDLYFEKGKTMNYEAGQSYRLLTCSNGIECVRLDREPRSVLFKLSKDYYHSGLNIASTLAHYSEADDTVILTLDDAKIRHVPSRFKNNVINVSNYENMLYHGAMIKALQLDRVDKFGLNNRYPFIVTFTDRITVLDKFGDLLLFDSGTDVPCAKTFQVIQGSKIYSGPRVTMERHSLPKTTTKVSFGRSLTVYLHIDEYGLLRIFEVPQHSAD